jgi:hypothetical protein
MVNLRRSNVWGHETVVVCVGIGRNHGRSGPAQGRERSRRQSPNEELNEEAGQEGGKEVNERELPLARRVLGLLGDQGLVLVPIRDVVVLGVRQTLDVLGIFGAHVVENKRW